MSIAVPGWSTRVFAELPQPLVVLSSDGRVVDANPATCRLCGRERAEFLAAEPCDLFEPDAQATWQALRRATEAARAFSGTGRVVDAEGSPHDVEIRGVPVDVNGESGMLCSLHPVTAVTIRAGALAHDLNNVTTVLHGIIDAAQREGDAAVMHAFFEEILEAARRIESIARHLASLETTRPPPSIPASVAPPGEEPTFSGERILVVDDDATLRRVIVECLAEAGCDARGADPHAAEQTLREGGADLVLCDVVMRGVDGPDVLARLRAVGPPLRVLFMSGYDEATIAGRGLLEPGRRLLAKPFTPAQLLRATRRALDGAPLA